MFQLWQELINGRNCEFKLTRDLELIPRCVGISLHMALSAKHWPETFCEHKLNSTGSARSTSPHPNFGPSSFPLAIVSQSPGLDPDRNLSQPAPFQADSFFSHYLFMSLGAISFPFVVQTSPAHSVPQHAPTRAAWHARETPWISAREDLP